MNATNATTEEKKAEAVARMKLWGDLPSYCQSL